MLSKKMERARKDQCMKEMVSYGVAETSKNGGIDLSSCFMETPRDGIGIIKFLEGKVFFITGATGFLAKVLVEKILRSTPDINKIYLMIKAENKEAAVKRLKTEILNADIFKKLRQKYGESFENFMSSKLIPVVGNLSEADNGLEEHIANVMAKEVDVIVNSAANTTFDERYDVSIDINTKGPSHLMNFAKTCKKLKLFLQVSTAYVNGQRRGRIMEKHVSMGDLSIAQEKLISECMVTSVPNLDVEYEIQLALSSKQAFGNNNSANDKMKKLGLQRAQKFGWQDTYVFSKAMGEMMLDHTRGEVPLVIIRPSIIESTYRDPLPGWIEGIRMMDPFILQYGKGQLTALLADPTCFIDVVPMDMVVNAMLAVTAKHGTAKIAGVNVYQVGSSLVNPLTIGDMTGLWFEYFNYSPFVDANGMPIKISTMKFCPSMEEYINHIWKDVAQREEIVAKKSSDPKLQQKLKVFSQKTVEKLSNLATIYEPYCFYQGRFDCSNMQKLMENMTGEEKMKFGFEMQSIDWKDYIIKVHIPGLMKHIIKEKGLLPMSAL